MLYTSICILLIAYATITIFGNHDSYFPTCTGGKKTKITTASWLWMQQLSFFTNYANAKINILRTLVLKMHVFINNETTPYNPMVACALWSYFDFLFWIPDALVMAAPTLVPPQQRAPCHKTSERWRSYIWWQVAFVTAAQTLVPQPHKHLVTKPLVAMPASRGPSVPTSGTRL